MGLRRRNLLYAIAATQSALRSAAAAGAAAPAAAPAPALAFPRDFGAHRASRIEWWYVTGSLQAGERALGFQVTFFRTRVDATQEMTSRFAARQLVFAHAALTDVQGQRLLHDQRIAREGFGIALAEENDTSLKLRDWSLVRAAGWRSAASGLQFDGYRAVVAAREFTLDLDLRETQPLLLQGKSGLSRKGPLEENASRYYSQPQLEVNGSVAVQGKPLAVTGKAWLDHEWSDALLHPDAAGWDWIGINLDDGSALTAFRVRRKTAIAAVPPVDALALWDGGSFRAPGQAPYIFSNGEVFFRAQRVWKSPLSGASYPVEWQIRTPADIYALKAVIDNQELDSRASTGAIYWEGLSDLFDSNGRKVGRGYLEMTGYAQPLRL